eukprot:2159970-Rhodomonas_salina.3
MRTAPSSLSPSYASATLSFYASIALLPYASDTAVGVAGTDGRSAAVQLEGELKSIESDFNNKNKATQVGQLARARTTQPSRSTGNASKQIVLAYQLMQRGTRLVCLSWYAPGEWRVMESVLSVACSKYQ